MSFHIKQKNMSFHIKKSKKTKRLTLCLFTLFQVILSPVEVSDGPPSASVAFAEEDDGFR